MAPCKKQSTSTITNWLSDGGVGLVACTAWELCKLHTQSHHRNPTECEAEVWIKAKCTWPTLKDQRKCMMPVCASLRTRGDDNVVCNSCDVGLYSTTAGECLVDRFKSVTPKWYSPVKSMGFNSLYSTKLRSHNYYNPTVCEDSWGSLNIHLIINIYEEVHFLHHCDAHLGSPKYGSRGCQKWQRVQSC